MRPPPVDSAAPPRCKLCGGEATPRYRLPDTLVYGCRRCDLHFIAYRDQLAAGDTALDARGRRYIEERLPAAAAVLPLHLDLLQRYMPLAAAKYLDIGAGVGLFLRRLQQAGAQGVGIEPSRLRRQFAREKFALDLDPEPVESRRWQEHFRGHFDAVTLWEVIEHVNDPPATLRGACNLLKPGGLLFLETPSRSVPAYRLSEWCYRLSGGRFPLFLSHFYAAIPFGHKQIFTPRQLTASVAGQELEILLHTARFPGAGHALLPKKDKIILVARKPLS